MEAGQIAVVDADALVAIFVGGDVHHNEALWAVQRMEKEGVRVVYPTSAIAEAVTYVRRVLNQIEAVEVMMKKLKTRPFEFADVLGSDLQTAMEKYFRPGSSKKNTLFDAIVAAVADKYGTKEIFSFDSFYKKRGFHLVTEK